MNRLGPYVLAVGLLVFGPQAALSRETRLLRYPEASTGGMRLVDGGVLVYPAEGKGVIENEGVSPDIEVENRPEETMRGVDRQLERAVAELMKRLSVQTQTRR
jgi:hypothetical protein